eukprot:CAMPEP_0174890508 /NCGR_PEP_ID=MMETSP0167-20121228/5658_1 /TAXON_ID=38298 /ORGANISM="Rhodella maculata, Strain CCMP736" /LENGTH=55 /DNA_ID=CAMNT_0016128329 /DNA_START=105 /DNA_END=268 /DNA_ORIENTATION=+
MRLEPQRGKELIAPFRIKHFIKRKKAGKKAYPGQTPFRTQLPKGPRKGVAPARTP